MSATGKTYVLSLHGAETPEGVLRIVKQSLDDPDVLYYGGILHAQNFKKAVQETSKGGDSAAGASLQAAVALMSYGTIGDVTGAGEASGNITPRVVELAREHIGESHCEKLRVLSLLTFYGRHGNGRAQVPIAELQAFLGTPTPTDVLSVVMSAVWRNMIKARLDPRNGIVYFVEICQGRDVSPGEVAALAKKLQACIGSCNIQAKQLHRSLEACDSADAAARMGRA